MLILFLLEITHHRLTDVPWVCAGVRIGRVMATLAIATTAVLYLREKEWLDAANLFLWIAVVALLEVGVRLPVAVAAHHKIFLLTALALYAALGSLIVVWLIIGKWMNAWDATLWLIAFGLLELNVLQRQKKSSIKTNSYVIYRYAARNASVNTASCEGGSRLMPAAPLRPPPVSKRAHSSSAPTGLATGARTLTV